jgi:Lectin C-type domain
VTAAFARCCILFAVACGHHDTPVATYHARLPAGTDGGTGFDGNAGDAGSGGNTGAEGGALCMQTYPTIPAGLTSRYKESAMPQTWVDAERDCESEGGHLIVIDDQAENVWMSSVAAKSVTNNKSTHQLSWIGLGDSATEGAFRWVSGRAVDLALWADSEPNSLYGDEDCVEIRATGQWNDDHCDAKLTYVCECDGATSAGEWCDTESTATCGDCSHVCLAQQTCPHQECM